MRQLTIEEASGSVLDFGAGKGLITRQLIDSQKFSRVVATDLFAYDYPPEAEAIVTDLNHPLYLADASFDVIVAVGILEYMENAYKTCREWKRLLRTDGLLIGVFANTESLRSLLSLLARGYFAGFSAGSTIHIPWTRSTSAAALAAADFSLLRWFYSDRGRLPLPSATVTWQQLSFGFLRGRRFSDAVGFVARSESTRSSSSEPSSGA